MFTEIKPITNFNGIFADLYYVTDSDDDYRRVWSVKSRQWLKPLYSNCGYVYFKLCKNGYERQVSAQILVATAFIPNDDPVNKTDVAHGKKGAHCNHPSNLSWKTHQANCAEDQERSKKISDANSKAVRCVETGVVYKSATEAGKLLGIQRTNITAVCRGKQKSAGSYHWEYAA